MNVMTVEYVKERVGEIRAMADDDERAHIMEDALYAEVLQHITLQSCKNHRELAVEVLKTESIDFARWCA